MSYKNLKIKSKAGGKISAPNMKHRKHESYINMNQQEVFSQRYDDFERHSGRIEPYSDQNKKVGNYLRSSEGKKVRDSKIKSPHETGHIYNSN